VPAVRRQNDENRGSMGVAEVQQRSVASRLSSRVFTIATGEGLARVANLLLVVFIGRTFGVRGAGAYALAQGLSLYQMQATDFGLRHIGARLAIQYPNCIREIVSFIQRRRIVLALMATVLSYLYGKFGPVPSEARTLVSLYSLSMLGYGFSVDWLAWGTERFRHLSSWRVTVSLLGLGITVVSIHWFHTGMLIIPVANGVAYCVADGLLWRFWARKFVARNSLSSAAKTTLKVPHWKETGYLGLALVVNQAFNSIDTMMLGGLSGSMATGLYNAAYRILLLVLATYYLGMQAIYPRFASIEEQNRSVRVLLRPLLVVAFTGVGISVVMILIRRTLISFIYGSAFALSAELARPLLFAIPLDFMTSLLLTALVAWGQSRGALASTGTAVCMNVLLNSFLIPRFGAWGAAIATPLSYFPYLGMLLYQIQRYHRKLTIYDRQIQINGSPTC
jgi:O-antigen/teichoic acid export membrane protein